jgi:hypothetical protein
MLSAVIRGLLLASVHPLDGHGGRPRHVGDVVGYAATFDPEVVAVFDAEMFVTPEPAVDFDPRPGISCDHSTFLGFDQRLANRACAPTVLICSFSLTPPLNEKAIRKTSYKL